MKHLFILYLLFFCSLTNAQDTLFMANKIGRSEYTQMISSDRIYPVIKGETESYFELLPSDYFHMNYRYDTIKISLEWKQNQLELNCLNCRYMQLGLNDSSVFYIESGDARIEFDWELMKKPSGGTGPMLKERQQVDERFGFVKIRNRSIHYAQIQQEPPLFLGFIDRNFNGKIDSTDYISLAENNYFPTAINSRVNVVKKVDTIVSDWWNATFRLLDNRGRFELHKIKDSVYSPALFFSKTIRNFQLDSLIELSTFLKKSSGKYTLVTFWNEYCPDCLTELDSLETLQNQFQVLTFYNRDNLENELSKGGWTFSSYLSNRFAEEAFQLNGMPYYWVLDKQRNCLFKGRNWKELRQFLSELNNLK